MERKLHKGDWVLHILRVEDYKLVPVFLDALHERDEEAVSLTRVR